MRRTWLIATTLMVALLAGCSTTNPFGRAKLAVKSGTQYLGGRGFAMYPTTPNLIENVKAAMGDLGMHSIHPFPDPNSGTGLEATTADKRVARVTVHSTGVRSTVTIKVGWLGDEPLTRSFLDRLQERQGALPESALPDEPEPDMPGWLSKTAVPDSVMIRNQLDSSFNPSISP